MTNWKLKTSLEKARVIVPDNNLLVYAHNDRDPQHVAAKDWWEGLLNGTERVGLSAVVVSGFVRIITNRSAFTSPMIPTVAVDMVKEWFEHPHVVSVNPGPLHLDLFRQNLKAAGVGGNLVTDAHIAAIAMEHQAEVHSNDSDFARFAGLRWHNPIRGE